jgi:hypothetical protein
MTRSTSELGSIPTEMGYSRHVRFRPISDHGADVGGCLKSAIFRLM